MKTWQKAISYHRTLPTASPLSWFQRKTQKRCDISLTTAPSMQLPGKMSHHSRILDSASKIYREWNSSANLTSDGAITTSASAQETSGREHSRRGEDYSSQKLCSLDSAIPLHPSNGLCTQSWSHYIGNTGEVHSQFTSQALTKMKRPHLRTTWTTAALAPRQHQRADASTSR